MFLQRAGTKMIGTNCWTQSYLLTRSAFKVHSVLPDIWKETTTSNWCELFVNDCIMLELTNMHSKGHPSEIRLAS